MNDVEVLVVGTGAAGLAAAVAAHDQGAAVGLLERGALVGGTSALSGGIVWVPGNPEARELGVDDSVEKALGYLEVLAHGTADLAVARVWLESGGDLLDFLARSTPISLHLVPGLPDKHPEHAGGLVGGGRAMEPSAFAFGDLGEWQHRIAKGGLPSHLMLTEMPAGGGTGGISDAELERREQADVRSLGQALIGGLLKACLERGIEPQLEHRARLVEHSDRGFTVTCDAPIGTQVITCRSLVIASGGFEGNPELTTAFLRGPMAASAGIATNSGDGLLMAMSLGAKLGTMAEAWWAPVIEVPTADGRVEVELTQRERTVPGSIMVNSTGRRFCNEATNYNSLGSAFHMMDPRRFDYPNDPAWVVLDDACLRRYGFLGQHAQRAVSQSGEPSDAPDWLVAADTLEELADRIGVPAAQLAATVEEWNEGCEKGVDPLFRRGESAYERFNGDHAREGTLATLGPLTTGPFHAARVRLGCLGTKGGPRTDADGQVFAVTDQVIPGLYAAGNAMAGITGRAYTGAGGTLGPALTFGMRAGRHAAGHALNY